MSAVLAAIGLSVLLWPPARPQSRARNLEDRKSLRRNHGDPIRIGVLAVPLIALVFFGTAAGVAGSMAAATAYTLLTARRRDHAHAAELASLLAALEVMVAELRVGAHPSQACRQAADDCSGVTGSGTAAMLRMMAGRAALGGDVADGIEQTAGEQAQSWQRVAVAWRTAEEYGLPMAELLTSVRADLVARHRFRERTKAALAGAKATALVLALLPLLGIGLGQAMGAQPLSVLFGGGVGGVLLVVGVGLVCGGLLWSRQIVGKVASL